MKLITSLNKEYNAVYVEKSTLSGGSVMIRIYDDRPLTEIATEFHGLEWIRRESENQGDKEWNGCAVLHAIRRMKPDEVLIELAKP